MLKLTVDDNDKLTLLKDEIDRFRLELGQPEILGLLSYGKSTPDEFEKYTESIKGFEGLAPINNEKSQESTFPFDESLEEDYYKILLGQFDEISDESYVKMVEVDFPNFTKEGGTVAEAKEIMKGGLEYVNSNGKTIIQHLFEIAEVAYLEKYVLSLVEIYYNIKDKPEEFLTKKEFTTARQVIAVMLLDEEKKLTKSQDYINIEKLIEFLTGKTIRNIQQYRQRYTEGNGLIHKSARQNKDDYEYVKKIFERLELQSVVNEIDKRIKKINKLNDNL